MLPSAPRRCAPVLLLLAALFGARLLGACRNAEPAVRRPRLAPMDAGASGSGAAGAAPESAPGTHASGTPSSRSALRIHHVQGTTHVSPYAGALARNVLGIVTCVTPGGFFLQDPQPDGDARTSEALFVSDGARRVEVGDLVDITAPVRERRASCHGCAHAGMGLQAHLGVTELEEPRALAVLSRGHALPAPVRIGRGGRLPPEHVSSRPASHTRDDPFTPLATHGDAVDFYESLENMLVEVVDARVVGPTLSVGGRRVLTLLPELQVPRSVRTAAGGVLLSEGARNPERLLLVSAPNAPLPSAAVGDHFGAPVRGLLTYRSGKFELVPCTALPPLIRAGAVRETSALPPAGANELRVAVLNVHNLAATHDAARFAALAELITVHLGSPDLIGLLEVQDDNGARDDAWVSAEQTLARVTVAIRDAGGPAYAARGVDPRDDADGGEPGANIRSVLLFRSDRGLAFVDRPGAGPDTENFIVDTAGGPRLAFSPGRLAPESPAFTNSRKPLAAELTFAGRTLFVVLVHLTSKLGDLALFDRVEPLEQPSTRRRVEQARAIADWTTTLFASEAHANVIVLGDFNDSEYSPALSLLRSAQLTPVIERLPHPERYTYVYDGNAEALDHILVSPALSPRVSGVDGVHRFADFPSRITDHDPLLAHLRF